MVVSKQKNIVVGFDKGVSLSNQEVAQDTKVILFNFLNTENTVSTDKILCITNPGEYEYQNILIKVNPELNIQISGETLKLFYINNIEAFIKDKDADIADILVIDQMTDKKVDASKIIELQKSVETKMIIINSAAITGELASAEKSNKLKIKKSELDLISETKLVLL